VHRKNNSEVGAWLTNSWLLGLSATPPWNILTSTSGQQFDGICITSTFEAQRIEGGGLDSNAC